MLIHPVLRRRLPLAKRIVAYLCVTRAPLHYTSIAKRLHADPKKVSQTYIRLAHNGTLSWCGERLYVRSQEKAL